MLFKKNASPKKPKEIHVEELDEGLPKRELTGWWSKILYALALCMSLFHIYALAISSVTMWYLYCFHLGMGAILTFALYCGSKKSPLERVPVPDICMMLLMLFATVYLIVEMEGLVYRIGVSPTTMDLVVSIILIVSTLEITRRTCGNVLPIIALLFLLYARYGHLIPGSFAHREYSWRKVLSYMMGLDGIFSTSLQASATFVFIFVVFGAFLSASGSGQFFIDLALSISGSKRGGPAKVAVISSALFGTVSGNSVANVVSTGAFTIPLMKSIGYKPKFAAAVEATSSTGGQIMPPILGSAAFVMASLIGVPYITIVKASILPALLYFYTVFIMVDLEAVKGSLSGMDRDKLPVFKTVITRQGFLILPLVVLILALSVFNVSPIRAGVYGIITAILVTYFRKETRIGFRGILNTLVAGAKSSCSIITACATAGLVVGVLNLTGAGLKFASVIVSLSHGNLAIALVMTMLASIILGMGLPTTASYLICAAVAAPALTQMGVSLLGAHMFVFYFACISAITPPVALAAYAGAGIAKAKPIEVAFTACKIGIAAFIVPFMFAYGPAILGEGTIGEILLAVISSLIGVTVLAFGLQRQMGHIRLDIVSSVIFVAASLLLIKSGIITDLIGVGLSAAVVAFTLLRNKRTGDSKAQ